MAGSKRSSDIDEEELAALEEDADAIVSNAISKIESAIDAWKAAGGKPEDLRDSIRVLQSFYDELVEWEKRSLRGKGGSVEERLERLREFVVICRRHEEDILGFG